MFYRLKKLKKKNVLGGGGEGGVRPRVNNPKSPNGNGDEPINYIQAWPWFH